MKRLLAGVIAPVLVLMLLSAAALRAQDAPTITVVNSFANEALVRICGPTPGTLQLPSGGRQTIAVSGGTYYLKVRYGSSGRYHFTKGQAFGVTQTSDEVSVITITLHSTNGNLGETEISASEFGSGR